MTMSARKFQDCHHRSHDLCWAIFTALMVMFFSVPCTAQLSFNFASFNANIHEINYVGDASPSNPVILLTINQKDKVMTSSMGRITYSKLMHLWDKKTGKLADFDTHFSFIVNSQGNYSYADGIAFFIAPDGFPIPEIQEGSGFGLVSGNQKLNSTDNPFVAVEFDTYWNSEWDPDGDHVGIDVSSVQSVANLRWASDILHGRENEAWISYNSSIKRLSVAFTGYDSAHNLMRQHLHYDIDMRKHLPEWVAFGFSGATGQLFEIHTLTSWSFSSNIQIDENTTVPVGQPQVAPTPNPEPSKTRNNKKVILGVVLGTMASASVLVGGLGFMWLKMKKEVEKKDEEVLDVAYEFEDEAGPRKFSYDELAVSTKNFQEDAKLGQGGFGGVYKGFLKEINSYVAVKRVSSDSKQGIKEYASEVKIINHLRHRSLVKLLGWCHEKRELLLVYEFMPNGSLDSHLFKENRFLTWAVRYNIARGLASALLYLHEEWEQCVLHRDIKSSNVLLDSNFNAKLGDFGLARLVDHCKGSQTTVLAGTVGYMAPECLMTGKSSKESDIYSFGIVALELGSGRKSIDGKAKQEHIRLVDWVWELYGTGKLVEAADPKLAVDFNEEQMVRLMIVGLWCVHPDHTTRPSIKQVIQALDFETQLPSLPPKMPVPTFLVEPVTAHMFSFASSYGLTGSDRYPIQSLSSDGDTNCSRGKTLDAVCSSTTLPSYRDCPDKNMILV